MEVSEISRLHEFLIAALIAMESLLLSVFGSLIGVYARYQTVEPEEPEDAEITITIRNMCYFMCFLIVGVAALALYLMFWFPSSLQQHFPFWILLALGSLIVLIPIPAMVLTWKMH